MDTQNIGNVVVGLVILGQLATIVITLMRSRTPPLAEEMAKEYASKTELREAEARFSKQLGDLEDRFDSLSTEMNANHKDTLRALGRIEGRLMQKTGE
jgi:hypothetical protein